MDLIVAVCRALANRLRLRLLQAIHERPGVTIQVLAERVKLPVDATSRNLKLLRDFHLVQTTPTGRYVKCSPAAAGSTSNFFLAEVQKLLKAVFATGSPNSTLAQVWNSAEVPKHGWDDVFNALVAHFTIFTHLRRLLILRHLAGKRACTQDGLVAAVRMSRAATLRHMDKLRRRGVVMAIADSSGAWTLVRNAGPPVRRKLLEIVLHALRAV